MAITISGDTPNFSSATITTGTVTTLNAPSGVLATQNGMTGIAKAWIAYNGNTQTIIGSFNVSSVTYVGTGNYNVNLTTALPNASNVSAIASSSSWVTQSSVTSTSVINLQPFNTTTGLNINVPATYCVVFSS
jgi:hypothetical protein